MATEPALVTPSGLLRSSAGACAGSGLTSLTLSNRNRNDKAEIILDYGRCEGGLPVFILRSATAPEDQTHVPFEVTYSETINGTNHDRGDGPFFLFSNAMDSYRASTHYADRTDDPQTLQARFVQGSQRYQKITLIDPDTTIVFSKVGFQRVRPESPIKSTFHCSNPILNRIWRDGARTVDMCTASREEIIPAWDITDQGTRVHGGHWAPCRQGTRWTDKVVTFEAKIEKFGLSWGTHTVANGLLFCLDKEKRTLAAFEGLSNRDGIFPVVEKGIWSVPSDIDLSGWLLIKTIATGDNVRVSLLDRELAVLVDLRIHPILGGGVNSGSVAFGGPPGWTAVYRHLLVQDHDGKALYKNSLLPGDTERTYADFQVGTNKLPCLMDGAKRDRACFGGDVFVTGRSIAYSTADFETWRGSLQLLLSHQTKDGYLGNLCPIQAPEHDSDDEPPTYAFYSITYALLLIVSVKDYWYNSGDRGFVRLWFQRLQRHMDFTKRLLNNDGLVEAPPGLSMTWFPMAGPIFGASASVNVAYFDALNAMVSMAEDAKIKAQYLIEAQNLKKSLISSLWNEQTGTMRLAASLPANGVCQDVVAYAITTGIAPFTPGASEVLTSCNVPPCAFKGLGAWGRSALISPYASGFALEALLANNEGSKAVDLLLRVWGVMADQSSPHYSGAHWEAMGTDGRPLGHDVSLVHAWSTWPVFLMPRYLAGVYSREPGWTKIGIEPVLAGLELVVCSLETPRGLVKVELRLSDPDRKAMMTLQVPIGVEALVKPPQGWRLIGSSQFDGDGADKHLELRK